MKTVYSVRIRKELRDEMERYKHEVDWSKEMEKFIEEKLREIKKRRVLQEIDGILGNLQEEEIGLHDKLLRDDRDSGH
ncbi:hypothetical protein HS7_14470 [Sulfolobales archaeon HS-7]|nr:hypothetical protein HS7_14470 [Sulfolobales archaeon HS-7]